MFCRIHLDIAGAGLLVGAEGSLTAPAFEGAEMVACGRVEDDVQRLHRATAPHALQRR